MNSRETNPLRGTLSDDEKWWFDGKEWKLLEQNFSQSDLEDAYREAYQACYNWPGLDLDFCWDQSSVNGKISYKCKK